MHGTADVAQLVEQRYRKPWVTGSIPVVGSMYQNAAGPPGKRMLRMRASFGTWHAEAVLGRAL